MIDGICGRRGDQLAAIAHTSCGLSDLTGILQGGQQQSDEQAYWPGHVLDYVGQEAFTCPVRSPLVPRFGGYSANGGWWLLESVWWSAAYKTGDDRIGDVRSPAQCAMI